MRHEEEFEIFFVFLQRKKVNTNIEKSEVIKVDVLVAKFCWTISSTLLMLDHWCLLVSVGVP